MKTLKDLFVNNVHVQHYYNLVPWTNSNSDIISFLIKTEYIELNNFMFMDDISNNNNNISNSFNDLKNLEYYGKMLNIKINPSKTKIIIFNDKKMNQFEKLIKNMGIRINGEKIEYVTKFKLLGHYFDSDNGIKSQIKFKKYCVANQVTAIKAKLQNIFKITRLIILTQILVDSSV